MLKPGGAVEYSIDNSNCIIILLSFCVNRAGIIIILPALKILMEFSLRNRFSSVLQVVAIIVCYQGKVFGGTYCKSTLLKLVLLHIGLQRWYSLELFYFSLNFNEQWAMMKNYYFIFRHRLQRIVMHVK